MLVFHMQVGDTEQDHKSVLVLKPKTDTLKPQTPALMASCFKGEFRGIGWGIGNGVVHACVSSQLASQSAVQVVVGEAGREVR
jgi:hypothetical protein